MRHEDATFEGMDVQLESDEFVRCSFKNCKIIYGGGKPRLDNNLFDQCRFDFTGPALGTLEFMKFLNRNGGGGIVSQIFDSITSAVDKPFFRGNDQIH